MIQCDYILLETIIPPSSNNQYLLVRHNSKTFHVPSRELSAFKKHIKCYPVQYPREFAIYKARMSDWVRDKKLLEVSCTFFLNYSRLFTKIGNPKRLDCSNRLKAIHDCVADLFGIDDCLFFKIHAEKRSIEESYREKAIIEIKPL